MLGRACITRSGFSSSPFLEHGIPGKIIARAEGKKRLPVSLSQALDATRSTRNPIFTIVLRAAGLPSQTKVAQRANLHSTLWPGPKTSPTPAKLDTRPYPIDRAQDHHHTRPPPRTRGHAGAHPARGPISDRPWHRHAPGKPFPRRVSAFAAPGAYGPEDRRTTL
ncbi:hypothetical protein BS50DRAFT_414949 [Corynespora cassiicola Philippines]|uniref:Uncharacterized protein n=1 Tax=Corynespora cassiicola Philippines TaxID=1448308 RepID=A0A2T2NN03_CORCC|nr:hypothetical protein BS50DRAFT_414949 [Corynespora cassiicola Philippines]